MLSKRLWTAVIMLGFVGSLAWLVENQFFNSFHYNYINPDSQPISWMVTASALTATFSIIVLRTLSDRNRYRWDCRPFILIGYVALGISTAAISLLFTKEIRNSCLPPMIPLPKVNKLCQISLPIFGSDR
jgi:MFS family permease